MADERYSFVGEGVDDVQQVLCRPTQPADTLDVEGVTLTHILRSSSIEDDAIQYIIEQYKNIKARCKWLLEYTDDIETTIPVSLEIKVLQDAKEKLLKDYATRIKSFQDIITNRDEQIIKVNDLLARKWINENKLIRKKDIQINAAISSCKTNALTTTKKDLTQILITNTYISRFDNEMSAMDCNHKIKVELVSKAEKGKAYHQVALRGAVQKKKTGEVLEKKAERRFDSSPDGGRSTFLICPL